MNTQNTAHPFFTRNEIKTFAKDLEKLSFGDVVKLKQALEVEKQNFN